MVTISLIITTYNVGPKVRQLCNLGIHYSQIVDEVIFVDDCSTDGSVKLLKDEIKAFKNIKFFETETNTGRPAIPRNIGISHVTKQRIIFCDDDDIITDEYIQQIKNLKLSDQNLYSANRLKVNNYDEKNVFFSSNSTRVYQIPKLLMHAKNLICFSGSSIPSDIAKVIEFRNEPLEDWKYWLDLVKLKQVQFFKFLDKSVFVCSAISLSPRKHIQLFRIIKFLGLSKMPFYFILTILLFIIERFRRFTK